MKGSGEISRRAALRLLAWWVGLGASPLRALAAGESKPLIRNLLSHRASAVAIGRQFLLEHPEERGAEQLTERLGLPPAPSDVSPEALRHLGDALRAAHRADLREGRVALLEGWVLSLTELRLAALLALESDFAE